MIAAVAIWYIVYKVPLPFVDSWWRAGQANWDDRFHRKARIADWLISSDALIGKSRPEIIELLGEPPPREYFTDWDIVYNLGAERDFFLSIDSEWLVIRMNSSGVATEADLARD